MKPGTTKEKEEISSVGVGIEKILTKVLVMLFGRDTEKG
jgi:hypothetical protein